MPAPISNLTHSLHPQFENSTKPVEYEDISVAPHLATGTRLRLSGNWLNQQKARLNANQQQLLNVALAALTGQDAVNDIRQDHLGGQFNLARPSYTATNVYFQRDEQAPDILGFINVKDRQGNSLLKIGRERSIASARAAHATLPGRADESSILANSRHDPKAAWQRDMYIVQFFTAGGEKAKVVGDYVKGDKMRFEVKNSNKDGYAILKRSQLDSGEPVWMLPEHVSIAGGAEASSSLGESHRTQSRDAVLNALALIQSQGALRLNAVLPSSARHAIEVVNAVIEIIREKIYLKPGNLQSSNKYNPGLAGDTDRVDQAADALEISNKNPDPLAAALVGRAHNCGALAHIAQKILAVLGFQAEIYEEFTSVNHAVVICKAGQFSSNSMPLDMKEWPADVYVCDTYLSIGCPAPDFAREAITKMNTWAAAGEKLYVECDDESHSGWMAANDSRWINGLLAPREDWSSYGD